MKKLFPLLLLAFCYNLSAQIVDIPDANFKAALLASSPTDTIAKNLNGDWIAVDANGDGEIQVSEAESIAYLNLHRKNISDLTGIYSFINLTDLWCSQNQLTNLDVTKNPLIKVLNCVANDLKTLDVTQNPMILHLFCTGNNLTNLDVTHNPLLEKLDCSWNDIKNLDVSQNPLLEELNCALNKYLIMDISHNPLLKILNCQSNELISLDVSQNKLLEQLLCNSNQLTNLDVSQNTSLKELSCSYNNLSSLDVSNNTLLIELDCSNNNLISLDLSYNPIIELLWCQINDLKSLDVSQNPRLRELECAYNKLTSLDVSHSPLLEFLSCHYNDLKTLDVTQNPILKYFFCAYNDLKTIDVTQNPMILHLFLTGNNLTSLDVSQMSSLKRLWCKKNELININLKTEVSLDLIELTIDSNLNLQYICAHDSNLSFVQNVVDDAGLGSTCKVNTFCNFTPDNDYKTIYGQSILDLNGNACDSTDANYPYFKIFVDGDLDSGYFYSNTNGAYQIFLDSANYMLIPKLENPDYFNVSPDTAFVDFAQDSNPVEVNFCIKPNGVHHDLEISIIPIGTPARPGFDADYKVKYRNKGTEIEDASIQFSYDDGVMDFLSSTLDPSAQASGVLTFELGQINPLEQGEFVLTFNLNSPMESPPLNANDQISFTATINNIIVDQTPIKDIFTLSQIVVNSYDPNDKTCLEGPILNPEMIGDYVHYKIRFENTGTFFAQNIIVRDSINPSMFDIATLEIIDASHDVATSIKGNNVEFIFENIALPFDDANNDGYIVFKIKTKNTLALKDEIKNSADIYFDFNFPIVTEDATSIYDYVGTNNIPADLKEILVYPNPAIDRISFDTDLSMERIEIYDLLGRLVMLVDTESNSIDVGALVAGKYQVLIFTKDELMRAGFVRE